MAAPLVPPALTIDETCLIGTAVTLVTRGTDRDLKDSTQNRPATCGDRLAEQTGKHVTKGRLVYVEGWLESRSCRGKDGKEREVTEVIAADVQFLDGAGVMSTDLPSDERAQDTNFDDLDIPICRPG